MLHARHPSSGRDNVSLNADLPGRRVLFRVGGVELDPENLRVWRSGREVRLGPVEIRILELLMERPEKVFSRAELVETLWHGASIDERTVDAHVARMRRVLGRRTIRTMRGRGYALGEA